MKRLMPGDIALITGDYGQGKSTLVKGLAQSHGRAVFWSAPGRMDAPPDFSDIATVVHTRREMERACRTSSFVVWPCPQADAGLKERLAQFEDFCAVAYNLREAVVVCDELQALLPSKNLWDAPPAFRRLVEQGHKPPGRLIKIFVAHRLAQIPLVLGGGAYRISFRPFPGDEDHLLPFFGRDGLARMKRMGVGEFAFWSQATGPVLPLRITRPDPTHSTPRPRGDS